MLLNGTVALVTGGAKRVGRAIALELARGGCDVAVHYRRSLAEAEEVVTQITNMGRNAVAVEGDLAEPAAWPRIIQGTVDGLGRLDILVNNASMFLPDEGRSTSSERILEPLSPSGGEGRVRGLQDAPLEVEGSHPPCDSQTPPSERWDAHVDSLEGFDSTLWDEMLRTNLTAPVGLCHHARRHLAANGMGKVVNVCDIAADRPWPDHLAYCASKAGLVAVTKSLARALAPEVQVNGVAPGIAVFPDAYSNELRRQLVGRVPLNRPGTPEEVALLVRFLVESADYITGQIIPIDGGRSLV